MSEFLLNQTVYILDDDSSIRKSLSRLLKSAGYKTITCSSANEFLSLPPADGLKCLILDVRMPGMSGLELQEFLNSNRDYNIPIIFITGHGDIMMGVRAMKSGAVDFLTKPFDDNDLIKAVSSAIDHYRSKLESSAAKQEISNRIKSLSPREYEILLHIIEGKLNKEVGNVLGISEKTVKIHRGRIMTKMKASSLAELVGLAYEAGLVHIKTDQ